MLELPLLDLDKKPGPIQPAARPRVVVISRVCVGILPPLRQCSSSFDAVHDHGLLDAHVILVFDYAYHSTKVAGLGVSL